MWVSSVFCAAMGGDSPNAFGVIERHHQSGAFFAIGLLADGPRDQKLELLRRGQVEIGDFEWDGSADTLTSWLAGLAKRAALWDECRELVAQHRIDAQRVNGLSFGGLVVTPDSDLLAFRLGRFRVVDLLTNDVSLAEETVARDMAGRGLELPPEHWILGELATRCIPHHHLREQDIQRRHHPDGGVSVCHVWPFGTGGGPGKLLVDIRAEWVWRP